MGSGTSILQFPEFEAQFRNFLNRAIRGGQFLFDKVQKQLLASSHLLERLTILFKDIDVTKGWSNCHFDTGIFIFIFIYI